MNKINSTYTSLIALVLSIAAIVVCVLCANCSKKDAYIEEALMNNPKMIINAMQNYEKQMMEEKQKEAMKAIEDNLKEVVSDDAGVIANPDGEIVLVEFFDFSCGYCHKVSSTLLDIAAKNPNVKIIGRELTFLGPISQYAAKVALAAKEQGKYAEIYKALLTNEGKLTEAKIDELAVLNGVDLEKLKADMNSETIAAQLAKTNETAGKIQIRGVPTLILNGKMIQGIDAETIQKAIDEAK
ncbi:MAG: DsbA family protein [Alphaproteobacteria bacterium]